LRGREKGSKVRTRAQELRATEVLRSF
jgi:hypothetical protein